MVIRQRKISQLENIIIEAIQESGLSQKELAATSGVSQGLISLFLERDFTKRRTITMPVADRLCRALGLRLVRHKKIKKVRKKMARMFSFREGCDRDKVRKLCKIAIKVGRGKMISERLLDELDSQGLKEETKNQLSKWVNPMRDEMVQPLFEYISVELFGDPPIERSG